MKRIVIWSALALGILVFGCAEMQERTTINSMTDEQVEAYNAKPENTDKIICRTEKPIGSNIPRRTCHKESWMKDRTRQDQRTIEDFQRNTRPPGPS